MGDTITVDITPEGVKTPEGAERVRKAMEAKDNAAYALAFAQSNLLKEYGADLRRVAKGEYDRAACRESFAGIGEMLDEVKELQAAYDDAQEEFLYAVAGRENPCKTVTV